jgi:hypothetical protein
MHAFRRTVAILLIAPILVLLHPSSAFACPNGETSASGAVDGLLVEATCSIEGSGSNTQGGTADVSAGAPYV